ncbi:hypothetical protein RND71_033141 [Anisodus tanguticus]|uniref:UBA domain-containing protein n=1 Tax=Anisodus tanguticus TaxID=243964 RepID=A0AAE1RAG9_9SOLA|nr:hypothetical protein RND71_033141 [Anisodus tanguticus]
MFDHQLLAAAVVKMLYMPFCIMATVIGLVAHKLGCGCEEKHRISSGARCPPRCTTDAYPSGYMHVLSNWLEKTCCLREGLELIRSHQLEPHLHQQLLQMAQPAGSTDQARQTITAPQATAASAGPPQSASESAPILPLCLLLLEVYDQAASNLVAGSNLEATVQQILDMGVGSWDRDTVVRSLRAAYNNPERAVEYLYSGIPDQAGIPPVAPAPAAGQAVNPSAQEASQPIVPSSGPNANPLDLFPQGLANVGSNAGAGNLDFLHNSSQNHDICLSAAYAPGVGNALGQTAAGAVPQAVTVTPEEREAIERLKMLMDQL